MKNKVNSAKNIKTIVKSAPKKATKRPFIAPPRKLEHVEGIEEIKVTFYQNEIDESNSLVFVVQNVQNIARDCIGNFYAKLKFFKDANAKLFNFSQPIMFKIEIDSSKLDSNILHSALKHKMKLQWTPQGCKRYSNRFKVCMEAMQFKTKNYTAEELEVFFK